MCQECGKSSCKSCDGGSLADLASQIDSLQDLVNGLIGMTKWLKGHPTIWIEDPEDVAMFDTLTGLGFSNWVGWGIENGNTYPSPSGDIITRNLSDRFLTMIGGTYIDIGETGGENFHTLIINEMPIHSHVLTDPGHVHAISDPGHIHTVTDPGHNHVATAPDHQHSFTTDAGGGFSHSHGYNDGVPNTTWLAAVTATAIGVLLTKVGSGTVGIEAHLADDSNVDNARTTNTFVRSDFTMSGTTDVSTITITVSSHTTGVTIASSLTGITVSSHTTGITMSTSGSGLNHENRPPYFAGLFVKKIF